MPESTACEANWGVCLLLHGGHVCRLAPRHQAPCVCHCGTKRNG